MEDRRNVHQSDNVGDAGFNTALPVLKRCIERMTPPLTEASLSLASFSFQPCAPGMCGVLLGSSPERTGSDGLLKTNHDAKPFCRCRYWPTPGSFTLGSSIELATGQDRRRLQPRRR